MELASWGRGKFSRLSKGYRELTKFLSDVLEGERVLIETGAVEADAPFEVRGDFARLLFDPNIRTMRGEARWLELFSKLSPYFEAGFMLRREDLRDSGALRAMFIFGKVFSSEGNCGPAVSFGLSRFRVGHVYRGRASAVLKTFRLEKVKRLAETEAFAMSPEDGIQFIFICGRPRLWQLEALEQAMRVMVAVKEAS